MVARGLGAPRAVARRSASSPAIGTDRARVRARGRRARRHPQGEEHRAALDAHRGHAARGARAGRRARRARRRASTTSATPGVSSATSSWSRATSSRSRSSSPTPRRRRAVPDRPTDSADLRAWLDSHVNLERLVGVPSGLEPPDGAGAAVADGALVELLGSPQLQYPAIHITGTNGKTSTARASPPRCSSPPGSRWAPTPAPTSSGSTSGSRGTASRSPTTSSTGSSARSPTSSWSLDDRPSYFEIINAAALEWFADVAVDVAVIEVGLGGRWDATNVVDGQVAVVTNVELDHVEYLGPTRVGIAEEKAGIVKPGATLVLGRDRSRAGADLHRPRPGAGRRRATATSACAPTRSRWAGGWSSSSRRSATLRRRVPPAARRAPGRQRGDRARGGGVRSSTARSAPRSSSSRSRR